jgi:hypothetical protein
MTQLYTVRMRSLRTTPTTEIQNKHRTASSRISNASENKSRIHNTSCLAKGYWINKRRWTSYAER